MTEEQPTELATYQHVDGALRRVPADEVTALRGAVYFAPIEADHEQGDEPVHICPACTGGWHGQQCQGEFWTTDEPPELVECECTEGTCRGEWVSVGFTTPGHGEAFVAPVGTPPPTLVADDVPTFQVLESHVTADGVRVIDKIAPFDRGPDWSEGPPIGPPIPVHREDRPDGTYVQGSIGPAHPAYAAVRAGLTDSLSIDQSRVETLSDNGSYVRLEGVRGGSAAPSPAAPVASPGVNADQVRVPAADVEQLQQVLADLATPKPPPRPNRATRRKLDQVRRRAEKKARRA